MRKSLFLAVALLLVAAPAFANTFINGGFEDNGGSFDSWTKGGGTYNGSYSYSGDPGKSAIVSTGTDPYTGGNLNMVYEGSKAARVNNYDWNYHFSTISQTVTNYTDPNIYFAWAAVIEDPGHSEPGHVRVTLKDVTTNQIIYNQYIDYYSHPAGVNWHTYNGWGYTDWNVAQLVTPVLGDTYELTVLASDCGWGGHGGYAYFDGFGAAPPQPSVPEPLTMLLLGSGLVGVIGFGRKFRK